MTSSTNGAKQETSSFITGAVRISKFLLHFKGNAQLERQFAEKILVHKAMKVPGLNPCRVRHTRPAQLLLRDGPHASVAALECVRM